MHLAVAHLARQGVGDLVARQFGGMQLDTIADPSGEMDGDGIALRLASDQRDQRIGVDDDALGGVVTRLGVQARRVPRGSA